MDDGQHSLAAQTPLPQLLSNENPPERLQRSSLPQKNTSIVVHGGQDSLVEASIETHVPEKNAENPRNELLGRHRTPAHKPPLVSPARPKTPKSHRNSDATPKRRQQTDEERRKGEATANRSPPPKWQIKILPVASARYLDSPAPSSPALMKLEAVFPLKTTTKGNATSSLAYDSEPLYIIIGRAPMDSSPASPRPRADEDDISDAHEKSLQEFIDEWEYDAEAPGVEGKTL